MELSVAEVLQRSINAHTEGNLQDAERLYRAILESQPDHPDANHNLGLLLVGQRRITEALPLFRKALQANSRVEQFWLTLISALIEAFAIDEVRQALLDARLAGVSKHKLDAMEAQLKLALDSDEPPQAPRALLLESYQSGEMEQAEGLARSLTDDFPNHPFAWKVLSAVLRELGRLSDAVSAARTVVTLTPDDAEAHCNLGLIEQELNQLEAAEVSYRRATAVRPDNAEAHFRLAVFLQGLGRYVEAEEEYRAVILVQPRHVGALVNLGTVLRALGNFAGSFSAYKNALNLNPAGPSPDGVKSGLQASMRSSILSNIGNVLKDSGDYLDAVSAYREAIKEDDNNRDARAALGYLLLKLGRFESGLQEIKAVDGAISLQLHPAGFSVEGGLDERDSFGV